MLAQTTTATNVQAVHTLVRIRRVLLQRGSCCVALVNQDLCCWITLLCSHDLGVRIEDLRGVTLGQHGFCPREQPLPGFILQSLVPVHDVHQTIALLVRTSHLGSQQLGNQVELWPRAVRQGIQGDQHIQVLGSLRYLVWSHLALPSGVVQAGNVACVHHHVRPASFTHNQVVTQCPRLICIVLLHIFRIRRQLGFPCCNRLAQVSWVRQ